MTEHSHAPSAANSPHSLAADDWQTIDTAPKDGRPVELCRPPATGGWRKRRVVAIWHDFATGDAAWIWPMNGALVELEDPGNCKDTGWIERGDYFEAASGFTHWRPILPLPGRDSAGETIREIAPIPREDSETTAHPTEPSSGPPTPSETWRKLQSRCREASGPDRELDGDVALAAGLAPEGMTRDSARALWFVQVAADDFDTYEAPHFSADLSDLKNLIKTTLPGWAYKLGACCVSDDAWLVPDFNDPIHGARLMRQFGPFASGSIWDAGVDIDRRPSGHEELAMLEAYCAARAEIEEHS